MVALLVLLAFTSIVTANECITKEDLQEAIIDVTDTLTKQQHMIQALTENQRKHDRKINKIEHNLPEAKNQFLSMGCLEDVLSPSCPGGRSINITYAEYGKYNLQCTDACCPPSPQYDCTEDVATNAEQDWFYIKYLCDNKTSCAYEYGGAVISECEPEYIADYMQIFYDCRPDPVDPVVGFTAWASITRSYVADQTVIFDEIESNFGGHFNPNTSTFTCPYHGTYLFSINILGGADEDMYAAIMRESSMLATALADNTASTLNQASALVIIECHPGHLVWVMSIFTGEIYSDQLRYSHFSGYLMQHLD